MLLSCSYIHHIVYLCYCLYFFIKSQCYRLAKISMRNDNDNNDNNNNDIHIYLYRLSLFSAKRHCYHEGTSLKIKAYTSLYRYIKCILKIFS